MISNAQFKFLSCLPFQVELLTKDIPLILESLRSSTVVELQVSFSFVPLEPYINIIFYSFQVCFLLVPTPIKMYLL